ncbi:MAG: hypothetical protein PHH41_09300, partial [Sulfurimonas sp.]|nr:hypothetical protein [Sulfurimonas sp.]
MLESTVWRQYHSENNFREKLAEFSHIEIGEIVANDKDLYNILKAKLTKKELKLFAMDSANVSDAEMMAAFSYDAEALKEAKYKVYKKLKQDKMRASLKAV